jgi:hypothetical protein
VLHRMIVINVAKSFFMSQELFCKLAILLLHTGPGVFLLCGLIFIFALSRIFLKLVETISLTEYCHEKL